MLNVVCLLFSRLGAQLKGNHVFRLIDILKNNSYISELVVRINSKVDNLIDFELKIKFQLYIV